MADTGIANDPPLTVLPAAIPTKFTADPTVSDASTDNAAENTTRLVTVSVEERIAVLWTVSVEEIPTAFATDSVPDSVVPLVTVSVEESAAALPARKMPTAVSVPATETSLNIALPRAQSVPNSVTLPATRRDDIRETAPVTLSVSETVIDPRKTPVKNDAAPQTPKVPEMFTAQANAAEFRTLSIPESVVMPTTVKVLDKVTPLVTLSVEERVAPEASESVPETVIPLCTVTAWEKNALPATLSVPEKNALPATESADVIVTLPPSRTVPERCVVDPVKLIPDILAEMALRSVFSADAFALAAVTNALTSSVEILTNVIDAIEYFPCLCYNITVRLWSLLNTRYLAPMPHIQIARKRTKFRS